MNHKNYLVIHKNEWERINQQAHPPVITSRVEKKTEEMKALAEKSQRWIKKWPDTDECHVKQFLKRKEENRLHGINTVKECERKKKDKEKRITNEAIRRARQMIFENGSYGKELISALLESKMLEEREAQIKLKAEYIQRAQDLEKKLEASETRYIDIDNKHAEKERQRKERTVECAQINKTLHQCRKVKEQTLKDHERKMELEDARLMQKLLDYEKEAEKKCQAFANEALGQQAADQKKNIEYRSKREQVDVDIAEVWRSHLALRRCRENQILNEIHKFRHNQESSVKNFELVQKLQEDSEKRYNNFVYKGIARSEEIEKSNLLQEAATKISNQTERLQLANLHKSQRKLQPVPMDRNKLFCLRQSLFTTGQEEKKKIKSNDQPPAAPTFLSKPTTLRDQLEKRSKEPSPWNGTRVAHINFAVNARGVFAECKHKRMVEKVIEAYRKTNHLDSNTLPVLDEELLPFLQQKSMK